jgi:hypothetical protein
MTRTRQRAVRPVFDDLEGRQLLSVLLETSPSAPAIATFKGDKYIAWRGTNNNYLNIEDLTTHHKITFTTETTSAAPALATFFLGASHARVLAIAWTGTDPQHHLNVELSFDGMNFILATKSILGQTTPASDGPALAPLGDKGGATGLAIGWTGTDHQLNFAFAPDGQHFGPANTLGVTSPYGPALTENGFGALIIAWTDPSHVVEEFNLETLQKGPITIALTNNAPSLVASNGLLFIAWTDPRQRLNVDNVDTQTAVPVDATSPYGPSLAIDPDGSMLDIAWTGMDNRLNVGSVPFPGVSHVV